MPRCAVTSHGDAHCRTRDLLPVVDAPFVKPISRVKCLHSAHMPHGTICSDGNVSSYAWHLMPGLPISSIHLAIEVPTPGIACGPDSDSHCGTLQLFPILAFPSVNSQAIAAHSSTNVPHRTICSNAQVECFARHSAPGSAPGTHSNPLLSLICCKIELMHHVH